MKKQALATVAAVRPTIAAALDPTALYSFMALQGFAPRRSSTRVPGAVHPSGNRLFN